MPSGGRARIDKAKWARVVDGATATANARGVVALKVHLSEQVVATGRVQTGAMRDTWLDAPTAARSVHGARSRVWSPLFYTKFQNDGTRGSVARPGGALRFKAGGGSSSVRAPVRSRLRDSCSEPWEL